MLLSYSKLWQTPKLPLSRGTSRLPAQLATRQFARLIVGCDISQEAIAQQKAGQTDSSSFCSTGFDFSSLGFLVMSGICVVCLDIQ